MKKLIDCLKVGDKIFDIVWGWGIVSELTNSVYEDAIHVEFEGGSKFYCTDGKRNDTDINPSLFLEEITLKQELPEFTEGEIVCVKEYNSSEWAVAKYSHKTEDGYIKVRFFNSQVNTPNHLTSPRTVECIKSFDKSHFQSK